MTAHVVIVLDVDAPVQASAIEGVVRTEFELLRLSEFGAPDVHHQSGKRGPMDWIGLSAALGRLVSKAREAQRSHDEAVSYHVVGQAPLPLFVQLGNELSAWAPSVAIHNRRKEGTWDSLHLSPETTEGPAYFDVPTGLEGAPHATGLVAVFVSTGFDVQAGQLERLATNIGTCIAGVVTLRPSERTMLGPTNAPVAARELEEALSRIPIAYPRSSGIILAVAGPATLALMAGRAFNPNVIPSAIVPYFVPPSYEPAVRLPSTGQGPMLVPSEPHHVKARKRTLQTLLGHIHDAASKLTVDDLPDYFPDEHHQNYLACVQNLEVPEDLTTDGFELSVLSRHLVLGAGLLEVLGTCDDATLKLLGPVFVLHEVYHATQGIQSTNYSGIGRAGNCLEELDYWADSFALETLVRAALRTSPELRSDGQALSALIHRYIDAVLEGVRAFDRAEHGKRLHVLPERRLRRYLVWALIRAAVQGHLKAEDLSTALRLRPQVEIAPLRLGLDVEHERIVLDVPATAELFIVVDKRLVRMPATSTLRPESLVESVRSLNHEALVPQLSVAVHEHPQTLAPWQDHL